jgi:hypothetical protein
LKPKIEHEIPIELFAGYQSIAPHLRILTATQINRLFIERILSLSEDVRVVKETVSRSVVAKRMGSNPIPRIEASHRLLQV